MAGGSRQTPVFDPEQQAFNRLVMGEAQPALRSAGGLPGLTSFRAGAVPGQQELDILNRIIGTATAPVNAPGFVQEQFQSFLPTITGGFEDVFRQNIVPSIVSQATAAGLGRSGAVPEAIARAGREFLQPAVGMALETARGLPLPGATELQRLPQGLQAAGVPRTAQLTEESQLRDLLLNLLFGQPIRSSFAGMQTTQRPDYLTPILSALGSGVTAAGTAPAGSRFGPPI